MQKQVVQVLTRWCTSHATLLPWWWIHLLVETVWEHAQVFVFMHEYHTCMRTFTPERIQVQTHAFRNTHTHKSAPPNRQKLGLPTWLWRMVKKDAQRGKDQWENDGDRWTEGGGKWCMRSCDVFNLEYGIMREKGGRTEDECMFKEYSNESGGVWQNWINEVNRGLNYYTYVYCLK